MKGADSGRALRRLARAWRGGALPGWLLLAAGAGLAALGLHAVARAEATRNWPSVPGEVVEAQLRTSAAARFRHRHYYALRYRYRVEERDLIGSRYSLGRGARASEWFEDEPSARSAAARVRPGAPVEVLYDPGAPGSAVLEPGAGLQTWSPLLLGALFSAGGWLTLRGRGGPARAARPLGSPAEARP